MIKCIIIEDQAPAQFILEKYVATNTNMLQLDQVFSDALQAREYLSDNHVDLIFLDINLPMLSGMDFLKTSENLPLTILTTAYSEFALECYQYNVVDYLVKPFSYERFSQAIEKVNVLSRSMLQLGEQDKMLTGKSIFFRSSHDLVKLKSEEIIFITSDSDYTEVITTGQKYLTLDSLRNWISKLDGDFIQVHRSFIINIKHLQKVSHNKIHLSKAHVVPIGRVFKKGFMEKVDRI